jgi:hypothetical protein
VTRPFLSSVTKIDTNSPYSGFVASGGKTGSGPLIVLTDFPETCPNVGKDKNRVANKGKAACEIFSIDNSGKS